ncbi:MAG: FlgD immunoglobulin-like domain containing protein [Bacteroidales bacterium]
MKSSILNPVLVSIGLFIIINSFGQVNKESNSETFTFKPGWTWLSFPRLERYKDKPFDAIPLLKRIDPWPPDYLEMTYAPEGIIPEYIIYNPFNGGWDPNSNLNEIKSTRGYKLYYEDIAEKITIRLEGAKLDYNTEIDLVEGDNWVGYFLDKNLYPQECLPPDLWKDLVQIKTQYWSMTKVPADPTYWFLEGKKAPFEYGDLVILKTSAAYNNFQWQNTSGGTQDKEIPKTSYYTFEEQADYLPFYIETDSTSDIQEIALLADGIVKGASVREAGDTLVEVKGYLEGVDPGAVIEFETWNGYKSQAVGKGAYVVIDHKQQVREKRNIHAGEKATYYHLSLKSNEVYRLPSEISSLSCQPNPFRQQTEFSFQLNKAGNVSLNIYDLTGKLVKPIINGDYPEGYYRFTWQGENEAGNQITPGVYFYKLSTGKGCVFSDKIVVVR